MKKMFTKLLAILMLMALTTSASATSMPPADQISADPNHASYSWRNPSRDAGEIIYVEIGISVVSSGLYLAAVTESSPAADTIGGIAFVQYWEDDTWKDYSRFYFEDYGVDNCELSHTISVPGGYYYRLSIIHTAQFGMDLITRRSTTQAVFVP